MQQLNPHPDSIIRTADGRDVQLKVHRGLWSGEHPENSLAAIDECYRAAVARTEIDLHALRDADFLVIHDPTLEATTTGSGAVSGLSRVESGSLRLLHRGAITGEHPPLLSEIVECIRAHRFATLVELDIPAFEPLPWPRVEELALLLQPVKDRVVINGVDWNVRRLLHIDPSLPVGFDPMPYLDWVADGDPEEAETGLPRGSYGYLDAHPLARAHALSTAEYLEERLASIALQTPGCREAHVRLSAFERMLEDGASNIADVLHSRGIALDVWTLNAGTPVWRERLARALNAGVDVITSDTPRLLARSMHSH